MTIENTDDRLLNELERQQKYLERLPDNFEFPLFNSRQALESQRRNGYRHTAAAAREIVDNAIEAGATKIHIVFERPRRLAQFQRKDSVSAVAFIDNGSGMLPKMARYALSWGAGTHFDEPDFIGKFGFGLPNASINQTRRVEVYTKTRDAKTITKAWLDVNEVRQFGLQRIEEPVPSELPEFVQQYLTKEKLPFDRGTVVVWVLPDRLSYRTAGSLREHLVDDFGVTYRNMLDDVELFVDSTEVEPVDPLFLDPKARYFLPEDKGGAQCQLDRTIPVRFFLDKTTGALHLRKLETPADLKDPDCELRAAGTIRIRISRLPPTFMSGKKTAGDDEFKRFEIRKPRRGMSFVRAGREIETLDAFPRSARDIASGLGKWPLLQGYAYYWGIEVRFEPALDDVFGITNDKQTVRPIEDFWRLLAAEDIDRLVNEENRWQVKHRAKPPKPEPDKGPTAAEQAAAAADSAAGRGPQVPDSQKPEVRERQEEEAKRIAATTGASLQAALAALKEEVKRRPYKIEYVDLPYGPIYVPEWGPGAQVIVKVNQAHPFYTTLYGELMRLQDAQLPKQAADVLLIALAKAELTCEDEQAQVWYKRQRESVWSPFLADALTVLAQTLRPSPDDPVDSEPATSDEDNREDRTENTE